MSQLENAIAKLLNQRYGDGIVYAPRERERDVMQAAIAGGFVSDEGFVTRKGRALLARAGTVNDLRG